MGDEEFLWRVYANSSNDPLGHPGCGLWSTMCKGLRGPELKALIWIILMIAEARGRRECQKDRFISDRAGVTSLSGTCNDHLAIKGILKDRHKQHRLLYNRNTRFLSRSFVWKSCPCCLRGGGDISLSGHPCLPIWDLHVIWIKYYGPIRRFGPEYYSIVIRTGSFKLQFSLLRKTIKASTKSSVQQINKSIFVFKPMSNGSECIRTA